MRRLRQIHLYLGCFFTPSLIFFLVTGAWQAFGFHRTLKGGSYVAPAWMEELSRIHMNAKYLQPGVPFDTPFTYFMLIMCIGVISTSILGVIMAFKMERGTPAVWGCLAAGVALPCCLVYA